MSNDPTTFIQTEFAKYLLGPQPKATLLHATPEAYIAQATMGYTGVYQATPLTQAQQETYWRELGETKLKGPLEMATTFWLVENVTRAFTHQLARYRLGTSMVQESQRFIVQATYEVHDPHNTAIIMIPTATITAGRIEEFIEKCDLAMSEYHSQIHEGVPVQDARALLPTHICTRLYLSVNLAALAHIYEQRTCCQAQHGEWSEVVSQFRNQLKDKGFPHYANTLTTPWQNPNCITCGFGANFDRPCKYQGMFDANLDAAYWKGVEKKG